MSLTNCRLIISLTLGLLFFSIQSAHASEHEAIAPRVDLNPELLQRLQSAADRAQISQASEVVKEDLSRLVEGIPAESDAATAMSSYLSSEGWETRVARSKVQIGQLLGLDEGLQSPSDSDATYSGKMIVVFVSRSVPISTLRAYARDLGKVGGILALRGAISGLSELGPTAEFAASVLKRDPSCEGVCDTFSTEISIDPSLFSRAGITKVPAVAVFSNLPKGTYCHASGVPGQESPVSYGDFSLRWHLQKILDQSSDTWVEDKLGEL